ncbi:hypothetical protein ACVI1T_004988 [Rhizobium redzepovicii]
MPHASRRSIPVSAYCRSLPRIPAAFATTRHRATVRCRSRSMRAAAACFPAHISAFQAMAWSTVINQSGAAMGRQLLLAAQGRRFRSYSGRSAIRHVFHRRRAAPVDDRLPSLGIPRSRPCRCRRRLGSQTCRLHHRKTARPRQAGCDHLPAEPGGTGYRPTGHGALRRPPHARRKAVSCATNEPVTTGSAGLGFPPAHRFAEMTRRGPRPLLEYLVKATAGAEAAVKTDLQDGIVGIR